MRCNPAWLVLLIGCMMSACAPERFMPPAIQSLPAETIPPDGRSPGATATAAGGIVESSPFNAANPVTITFLALEDDRAFYQPLIERFELENPGILVQFIARERVPPELQWHSGSVADTFIQGYTSIADEQYDLSPFLAADPLIGPGDFYPGALEGWQAHGIQYALPASVSVQVLAYNKDLFAAHGIPEPTVDWTWPMLRDAALALAQSNPAAPVYGLIPPDSQGLMPLTGALAQRDIVLDWSIPSTALPRLDSPAVEQAVMETVALYQDGAIYNDVNRFDHDTLVRLIEREQVGMWPEGLLADQTTALPFSVGVVPFPEMPWRFVQTESAYAMSRGTQHPEAAWRWLRFLSQQYVPPLPNTYSKALPFPARRSVAQEQATLTRFRPDVAAALATTLERPALTGEYMAVEPFITGVREAFEQTQRGADPRDALRASQTTRQEMEAAFNAALAQPTPTFAPVVVATPVPPVDSPAAAITLRFSSTGLNTAAVRQLAQQFTALYPEYQITIPDTVQDQFGATLPDLAATYDCFASTREPSGESASALLDLQPLLDADRTVTRADYPETVLAPFQHNGRLYGLPYRVDLPALHYRPALLDAAGLPPPTAEWTGADLQATARQLTDAARQQYGYAVLGGHPADLAWLLTETGATIVQGSGDAAQPRFTDPQVVQALQSYVDLLRTASPHQRLDGYAPDEPNSAAEALVESGQVALWHDTTLQFGTQLLTGTDTALTPLPGSAATRVAHTQITTGLYIAAQTPQAAACWEWLTYLSGAVEGLGGGYPARISVAEADAFAQQAPTGAVEVYRAYRTAWENAPRNSAIASRNTDIDRFWFYRAIDRALQNGDLQRELADAHLITEQHLSCVRSGETPGACARSVDPEYAGWASE